VRNQFVFVFVFRVCFAGTATFVQAPFSVFGIDFVFIYMAAFFPALLFGILFNCMAAFFTAILFGIVFVFNCMAAFVQALLFGIDFVFICMAAFFQASVFGIVFVYMAAFFQASVFGIDFVFMAAFFQASVFCIDFVFICMAAFVSFFMDVLLPVLAFGIRTVFLFSGVCFRSRSSGGEAGSASWLGRFGRASDGLGQGTFSGTGEAPGAHAPRRPFPVPVFLEAPRCPCSGDVLGVPDRRVGTAFLTSKVITGFDLTRGQSPFFL
jgi:hypothetical protein